MFIFIVIIGFLGLASSSSVVPGAFWTDTHGIPIQAHGGGFLRFNNTYYWFGEDKTENSHHFRHINVYKSTDLVSWEYLRHALSATAESAPASEIGPDAVVERPKVIYNERTEQFVMWFHLDSNDYSLAKLGLATSSTVQGPYTYRGSVSPFGEDSRDMTVWVDDDEDRTAYLFYATRVNLDTVIAKLSDDYLTITEKVMFFDGIHREAYAVFKNNGLYYMVTSAATGWDSNRNNYYYSSNMSGPWSQGVEIAPESSNTYDSQSNYIIPIANDQYIFAGDRWNRYALSDSRYMWLPIQFGENNSIKITWKEQWWVDTNSGNWNDSSSTAIEADSSSVTLIGGARPQPCSGCTGGTNVGYIGFDGLIRFNGISVNQTNTYTVLISYANGDSNPRSVAVRVNGVEQHWLSFPTSGNGQSTTQLVFHPELVAGDDNSLEFLNANGWAPDFDFIRVIL